MNVAAILRDFPWLPALAEETGIPVSFDGVAIPSPAPKPDRAPSLRARLRAFLGRASVPRNVPFRNDHHVDRPADMTPRQFKLIRRAVRRAPGATLRDRAEFARRCRGGDAVRPGAA